MRLLGIITAMIMLLSAMTSCLADESGKIYSVFGIDARSAEVLTDTDSHGWLGDGERFLVLEFSDETTQEAISEAPDWRPLPANESINAVIWGIEYDKGDEHYGAGPYIFSEISKIENGWYCFSDRSPDGHRLSGDPYEPDFSPPLNFTFAVYDADEDILYYVESDS